MKAIIKALESRIDVSEKLDRELARLRLNFEDFKRKIESLERELVIAKDEFIILNGKCVILVSGKNILFNDNIFHNSKIDSFHNSIDMIESNERMTRNFHHSWSKAPGLRSKFPKPVARPSKELQNRTFMGDIMSHTYSNTHVSPLSSVHDPIGGYQSLILRFKPITVTCPNSRKLPALISLNLN